MAPKADVGSGSHSGGASAKLATRGARLAATSIDDLIVVFLWLPAIISAMPTVLSAAVNYSGGASFNVRALVTEMLSSGGAVTTGLAFIAWGAVTARLVWANGQTIGKRIVSIKVVRKDGSRASFARIFWLRNMVNSVPYLLPVAGYLFPVAGYLFLLVGNLYQLADPLLIFTESRQCLHDLIADTIVVQA